MGVRGLRETLRDTTVIVLATTLGAAGCAPGYDSKITRPADRPVAEITTDPSRLGQATLVVWDQEIRGGQEKQITALNESFQRKYPNIKVKRVPHNFDDLRAVVKLGLTGNDPPDVVQVNNGRQDMGAFVKAGLLQPLDSYAETYRWRQRFPTSVLRLSRYPDTGDSMGDGKLYGLPQTGELVGVYYNKGKLAALGLHPPRTWAEFDAALAAAKAAGELPLQMGNLDKSQGIHLFGFALNRFVPAEEVYKLATGRAGVSWQTDRAKAAADQLGRWVDQGYLPKGFAGTKADAAYQAFAQGEGLFHISGTWLMADLQEAMGNSVGFALPPAVDGRISVTGGTGLPFAVSARSKHPDAAAAYVEYITSSAAMTELARTGNLPVVESSAQVPPNQLSRDAFESWGQASEAGGLVPYLDYATPTAYETVGGNVERLLAKQLDTKEMLRLLQTDLDLARGGR